MFVPIFLPLSHLALLRQCPCLIYSDFGTHHRTYIGNVCEAMEQQKSYIAFSMFLHPHSTLENYLVTRKWVCEKHTADLISQAEHSAGLWPQRQSRNHGLLCPATIRGQGSSSESQGVLTPTQLLPLTPE